MTPQDLAAFAEMFQDLTAMFKFYGTEDQKAAALSAYFQTLQRYPLDRVRVGYETLKETAQKWPVPAQWIAAMPRSEGGDLPLMDWRQVKASDEAERLFYEGPFCRCDVCTEASATHLNLRYVPCLDANGDVIPMRHPHRSRPVMLGRWIHGHELKRWYVARAQFYERLHRLQPKVKAELETQVVKAEVRA